MKLVLTITRANFEDSNYMSITNTGGYFTLEVKLSGIDYDEIDEYYYLTNWNYKKGDHMIAI